MSSKQQKVRGNKWLRFYINWRFPIGLVLDGLYLLFFLTTALVSDECDSLFWLLNVLTIVDFCFSLIVYLQMQKMTSITVLIS